MTWWEGAGVAVQEPWSGEQRSVILLTLLIPCPAGTSFAFQRQKKKRERKKTSKHNQQLKEKTTLLSIFIGTDKNNLCLKFYELHFYEF